MQETLASILQQRMDKCTTEQFWATGVTTGLNAFFLTQKATLMATFSPWTIMTVSFAVSVYAIYFIAHRHTAYYSLKASLIDLVKNEAYIPEVLMSSPAKWSGHSISGVLFYSAWVLLGCIGIIFSFVELRGT